MSSFLGWGEQADKPAFSKMWTDTFAEMEPHLAEQKMECESIRRRWAAFGPYQADAHKFKLE